jgi:hypothetical protein
MPVDAKLIRGQRDDPFFIFYYISANSKFQISFTFDPFTRQVSIINVRSEKSSQTVVTQQVVTMTPIKN